MLMSFADVCTAVQGSIFSDFSPYKGFDAVCVDSRQAESRALFVPLRGLNQDGHNFIEDALKNGASLVFADTGYIADSRRAAVLTELCRTYHAACITVSHTLSALQAAAAAYLRRVSRLLKIGVTGSNGKTTTKELLGAVFSQKYRTVISKGNLNSETGLPLSVFTVREEHEAGIFELGMNRAGEIAELAAVLRPDIAVITNVGTAHIGMIGSKEKIAEEKKAIFSYFTENCTGFVPQNSEYAAFLGSIQRGTVMQVSVDSGSFHLEGVNGAHIQYKNELIYLPLAGIHNVYNAFTAIAVAEHCGIPAKLIKTGLEQVKPLFGRSQIIDGGSVMYLLDCYNANPDSMQAALDFCSALHLRGRKIYLLASMRELGELSEAAHKELCTAAFKADADALFFFGAEICEAARSIGTSTGTNKPFFCFEEDEAAQLMQKLDVFLQKDDFVCLKGSRSLALEQFEPVLRKER